MITVTREELYEEVWSKPMTKACKKYGISDVGLKKICKKHEIPTPVQGYWAKLAAGKTVKKINFPGSGTDMVTIQGNNTTIESDAELSDIVSHDVTIPDALVSIAQLMKDRMEKQKHSRDNLVTLKQKSSISISVKQEAIERTVNFLQKLIVIGRVNGVHLVQGEEHLMLESEDEKLSFSIHAKMEKEPYLMTPKEQLKLSEWRQKRKTLKKRNSNELFFHDYREPKFPKYIHQQSELLVFEINDGQYSGIRRTFADGKVQRIEKMIETILMTAKKHIAYRIMKRKEREEDEIRSALRQRLWQEQTKFRTLEEKRIKAFDESFQLWQKYEKMKRFLVEARHISNRDETSQQTSEWINWSEKYIELQNPFKEGIQNLPQMEDFSE